MLATLVTHSIAFVIGLTGGWFACKKYGATAAADISVLKSLEK